jgi:hypothetical protein
MLVVVAAFCAAALPVSTAVAKKPEGKVKPTKPAKPSKPAKPAKGGNLLLKGTVSAVDAAGSLVTVTVSSGSSAAQALAGQSVQFDLTGAQLQIVDSNADGVGDLGDTVVGDQVMVHAKVASGAAQPYGAKQFKDEDTDTVVTPDPDPDTGGEDTGGEDTGGDGTDTGDTP